MLSNRLSPAERWSFVPLVVLGLLPFGLFPAITLVRRVFSVHDVQAYFYPYHVLPATMLAQGHLPLWNPYAFSGIPLLGDGQTAMFYPPNWLFFLVSGGAALNHVVLLQFGIAGIGMYLFARALDLWRLPAFIAALAYMFCGFMTARVVHLSIMSGAAMIPLILFCADRLLETGYRRMNAREVTSTIRSLFLPFSLSPRWLAATALALGLQALAGHPQVPIYTALALGLYAVVRSVEQGVATRRWRVLAAAPLFLAGAYLVGYALAAVQLVPWMELARLSVRAAGASFAFIFQTSTSGAEWLLFLFPYLLGAHGSSIFAADPIRVDQAVRVWEHSAYVGILPLALAAVGLGHFAELTVRRWNPPGSQDRDATSSLRRHRWYSLVFLLLLLLVGLILAAGWNTPVSELVYAIPVLGSLRAVERALVLAAFALTLLGGFGLQRVLEHPARRAWLLLPAALIVAVPAFFVWQASQPDRESLLGIPAQDLENLSLELPLTYIPLLLASGSGLLLAWWSRRPAGAVTQALAAALVLVDLAIYTTSFTPTASRGIYRYHPDVLRALHSDGEPFRKATVLITTNDLPNRVALEALALSWGMVHGVEDINGFNSLQPRRYTDYLFGPQESEVSYGYLRDGALLQPDSPILSSLNVRYVLIPAGTGVHPGPHLRPVFANASVQVYENTLVLPRAYFADRVRGEIDPQAVLQAVTAPGFDGRREALVESAEPPSLSLSTTPADARVTRAGPNVQHVVTTTAEPRFLVTSEMYFPGWRAYLDGVETPIYRTNYLFRGVVVPAGQHTVTFVYRPSSVVAGATITSLAMIALTLLLSGRRLRIAAGRVPHPASRTPGPERRAPAPHPAEPRAPEPQAPDFSP